MRKSVLRILIVSLAAAVCAVLAAGLSKASPTSGRPRGAAAPKAPAAVRLVYFVAAHVKGSKVKVLVRWKTGSEPNLLGFNIYRDVKSKVTKVNRGLIPSRGSAAGAAYSMPDNKVPKGVSRPCYRLETVDTTGAKTPLGGKACVKK